LTSLKTNNKKQLFSARKIFLRYLLI